MAVIKCVKHQKYSFLSQNNNNFQERTKQQKLNLTSA